MSASLSVPTATTLRQINAGAMMRWRQGQSVSGDPPAVVAIIAHALVQAIAQDSPAMRHRFESDAEGSWRVDDGQVNLGIAVAVSSTRGSSVLVPVVRGADRLSFDDLQQRIAELAQACRAGTIAVSDLRGANVLLTSVGTFGSTGGIPRLPVGPGCIIAAGRIAVPVGLEALAQTAPIDPVMLVTSTYDHRVIQGADSGAMLAGFAERLTSVEYLDALRATQPLPTPVVVEPDRATSNGSALATVPDLVVEFDHLDHDDQKSWWREQLRGPVADPSDDIRRWVLRLLVDVAVWERFLQRQFLGIKTLSVEGLDSSVVAIAEIARRTSLVGGSRVEIGMAHRGRLALMARVLQWPLEELLREFLPDTTAGPSDFRGDVRQHLGGLGSFVGPDGRRIDVCLEQNPSHLEFAGPVALGAARAAQDVLVSRGASRTEAQARVVPVLAHGDAAFAGQGVVYETFNLSGLPAYSVGGTIHIIQDNQLGFTATCAETRSTRWPSDVVRGFGVPVIRVDADDVEGVLRGTNLALAFRQAFGRDVVLHIVGFRRHGHNETDEPRYTQPRYYAEVDAREGIERRYADQLVQRDASFEGLADSFAESFTAELAAALAEAKRRNESSTVTVCGTMGGGGSADDVQGQPELLTAPWIEQALRDGYRAPDGFTVNTKLTRQFRRKLELLDERAPLDWAQGEYLALRLLAEQRIPFRLIGEDTERGTFSQRHLVLHDEVTGARHERLGQWSDRVLVANSPLTETATLAFEYGYTRQRPDAVSMWEAQFGDFVNVAQVITDQFIAAGRQKWARDGRLVMLLPHGWEGAGPEHSSARLERFLQLTAWDNMNVLYPTSAVQYFAALVEAATGPIRPTIIMTPKSLLRSDDAASPIDAFVGPVRYHSLLTRGRSDAPRVVLATGKVGVELAARGLGDDVRLILVERLYPFPESELRAELERPGIEEVVWLQEEPENMGAWWFMSHQLLRRRLVHGKFGYIGGVEASSPAEGYATDHALVHDRILTAATQPGVADAWLLD